MRIDAAKCVACANCIPACPMGAIVIDPSVNRAVIDDDECVEECYEQYEDDVDVCRDTLNDRLDELDEQAEECFDLPTFPEVLHCLWDVFLQRFQAKRDFWQCKREARARLDQCIIDCQQSPSAP